MLFRITLGTTSVEKSQLLRRQCHPRGAEKFYPSSKYVRLSCWFFSRFCGTIFALLLIRRCTAINLVVSQHYHPEDQTSTM